MKKRISILVTVLFLIVVTVNNVFAASDTTDGADEIFYEWVEGYSNIHGSSWDNDLYAGGGVRETINFMESDAPNATSNVVENLAWTIINDNNPWYINDYYTNDNAMERDWDYLERAAYNIETADIAIFGGHGLEGKQFQFNRLYTDPHFTHADADFGYNDLDWVFLFTCNWFANQTRVLNANILGGAHSIMSYGTTMYMDPNMSIYLGEMLNGVGSLHNVEAAWHEMNRVYPGLGTDVENPTTSIVYGATVDRYEYIWDEGWVGSYPGNNPTAYWSSVTYTELP